MNRKHLCLILILLCELAIGANKLEICRGVVSRLDFSSVNLEEFSLKPAEVPTVSQIKGDIKDQNFAVLKLTGNQWRSKWSPDGLNEQGDPRNLLILLGEDIAFKLGFKWIDKTTLRVPKGSFFTKRLKKLNDYLRAQGKEPLEFYFYDTTTETPNTQAEFLNQASRKYLPVANAGHFLIHDVAVHYGAILIPKEIVRILEMKVFLAQKLIKEFEPFLQKLPPEVAAQIRENNQKWLQIVTSRVDTVTGNFTFRYVDQILSSGSLNKKAEIFESRYLSQVRNETPQKMFENWFTFLFMNLEQFRFQIKNFDELFDSLYNFTKAFKSAMPQGARAEIQISSRELIEYVEKRRLDISLWDGN